MPNEEGAQTNFSSVLLITALKLKFEMLITY